MRQSIRNAILFISLLLFPITMNYLSPYISVMGALSGVLSGSLVVFIGFFVTGIIFGRSWCGWFCPMSGLSEYCLRIHNRIINRGTMRIVRYTVFALWFGTIATSFILGGGIHDIDPLLLTESGISVDEPLKYITYYAVLLLFFLPTILIGRRGACQSFCWMTPFLTMGYHVGRILKVPQLRIVADSEKCVQCGQCDKKCSMSIPVRCSVSKGIIETSDCILCGECRDICKKAVLTYKIVRVRNRLHK